MKRKYIPAHLRPPTPPTKGERERVLSGRATGAEIARASGLSPQRVSVLLKRGMSAAAIVAAQEQKRRPTPPAPRRPGGQQPESFESARTRKEVSLADLRQIQLDRERGELISRAEHELILAGAALGLRQAMGQLPELLLHKLDMRPGAECGAILHEAYTEMIDNLFRHVRVPAEVLESRAAQWRGSRAAMAWERESSEALKRAWASGKARVIWRTELEELLLKEAGEKDNHDQTDTTTG